MHKVSDSELSTADSMTDIFDFDQIKIKIILDNTYTMKKIQRKKTWGVIHHKVLLTKKDIRDRNHLSLKPSLKYDVQILKVIQFLHILIISVSNFLYIVFERLSCLPVWHLLIIYFILSLLEIMLLFSILFALLMYSLLFKIMTSPYLSFIQVTIFSN